MSLIITSLAQDPSAIVECLAAALTACYVGKLTFSTSPSSVMEGEGFSQLARSRQLPSNSKAICRVLSESAKKPVHDDFRKRFLRLFAVGELVPLPKKSLRRQNTFWHR